MADGNRCPNRWVWCVLRVRFLLVPCDTHTHTAVTLTSLFPVDSFLPQITSLNPQQNLPPQHVYPHHSLHLESIELRPITDVLQPCVNPRSARYLQPAFPTNPKHTSVAWWLYLTLSFSENRRPSSLPKKSNCVFFLAAIYYSALGTRLQISTAAGFLNVNVQYKKKWRAGYAGSSAIFYNTV